MLRRKAQTDMLKMIVVGIISAFIFIYFAVLLSSFSQLTIDETKINTQLVLNKLFNGKCFSDDFATFEKSNLNQDTLHECFRNTNEDILFRIKASGETDYLYSSQEDLFNSKKAYCNLESNILCTRMIYPITLIDSDGSYSTQRLLVEIITF